MRRALVFKAFLICCLLSTSDMCFAANKYIRAGATGSNSGADWTNAYPSFASVVWTRGNTYYVAGGTYSENITIPTAESGVSWIIIKKANAADNSGAPGWDASFATTQAVINGTIYIHYGYFKIEGVTGSGASGHGIKFATASDGVNIIAFYGGYTTSPREVHHVEVQGPGYGYPTKGTMGIYWNSSVTNSKGLWISNCFLHGLTTNPITIGTLVGTSYSDYGALIENNYISDSGSTNALVHGQGIQIYSSKGAAYFIIRNNTFKNILGSSNIAYLGITNASYKHQRIYNNVFFTTDKNTYHSSPSVIWTDNTSNTSSDYFFIYNNTFYNISLAQIRIYSTAATTTVEAINNLWVNSNFSAGHAGLTAVSNNSYYNNTGTGIPTREINQITESADPFTNSAGYDFQLKYTTNAKDHGMDLSSIFSTDILGNPRGRGYGWDIGAYEYDKPEPPLYLKIK